MAWFVGAAGYTICSARRSTCAGMLVRTCVLVLFLLITGFSHRLPLTFSGTDASVSHRFDLWRGALKLIASSPLTGWEIDQSGVSYSNWFQNLNERPRTGGLVSGYLTLLSEVGLPAGVVVIGLGFSTLLSAWKAGKQAGENNNRFSGLGALSRGCFASVAAFLASCAFSTFDNPVLFILPLMCAVYVHARSYFQKARDLLESVIIGLCSAACLSFLLFLCGVYLLESLDYRVDRERSTVVVRTKRPDGVGRRVVIYSDSDVLGLFPGRLIRELFQKNPKLREVQLCPFEVGVKPAGDVVLYIGRSWKNNVSPTDLPYIVIHPLAFEESALSLRPKLLLLPEVGEQRDYQAWTHAAQQNGWTVYKTGGVGIDLRPMWSEAIAVCLRSVDPQ